MAKGAREGEHLKKHAVQSAHAALHPSPVADCRSCDLKVFGENIPDFPVKAINLGEIQATQVSGRNPPRQTIVSDTFARFLYSAIYSKPIGLDLLVPVDLLLEESGERE